jgi:hypothetical protein
MKFPWSRSSKVDSRNASNGEDKGDDIGADVEVEVGKVVGNEWLKTGTSHLFLCELLSKKRTPQNIQGALALLKDLCSFKGSDTVVPEDINDDPNKVASDLLQVAIRITISAKGKVLANRFTFKALQRYFSDQWSYRADAVARMKAKLKGHHYSSIEIRQEAESWIKATAKGIKQADEASIRKKLKSVIQEVKRSTRDGGDCFNRATVVESLLDYEPWGSPKSRLCELVSCSDDSRVTVVMLNFHECQVGGMAALLAKEVGLDELAKWKCTKGSNAGSESLCFTSNIHPSTLLSPRSVKTCRGALSLTPVRDDWCVFKHREENQFILLSAKGDTLLVNHNGLAVADVTEQIGDDLNMIWRLEWV